MDAHGKRHCSTRAHSLLPSVSDNRETVWMDSPAQEFPQDGVNVYECPTSHGHVDCKLGIAEAGEDGCDGGEDV